MSTKIVCFDGVDGAFWGDTPELVVDPRAVKVEVPADVAYWRLSFDVETQVVTVKFDGMTDEEASAAAVEAEAEATAAREAAREAANPTDTEEPPTE